MITKQQVTFMQQTGKWVCALLLLLIGTFATNQQDAAGQTVPGTGRIIVKKVTQPNPDPSETSFAFAASGGLSPATFSLRNGQMRTFSNVPAGVYSITEQPTLLWEVESVLCSDGSAPNNIQLAAGEIITCTFTNRSTLVDLSLSKQADKTSVSPSQQLRYTLAYRNDGLLPINNVVLTEQVPANTTFDPAASNAGWQCTGTTCKFAVGTVPSNSGGTVDFAVQVDASVPAAATVISNRATIGTAAAAELAVATLDTTLTATADLTLAKSAEGSGSTTPGSTIIYQLTYKNQGNRAAAAVVLTETLPDQTTFDANKSSNGWSCSGASCQLALGTVAGGATATVTFAVKVANPLPTGVTSVTNSATIADNGANGADPTPENNTATVTLPVNRTFVLVANKRDALTIDADQDGVPSPGDTIEYTIQIRNNSNAGVRNLRFSDTPDVNSTLLPGVQTSQGTVTLGNQPGDNGVEVALGDLAGDGKTVTIRFSVQINPSLPLAVTAIQNQGVVRSDDLAEIKTNDPDTDESNDATRTPLRAFAQLQATLIDYLFADNDGNGVVSLGDSLIYRLTLDNTGNGAAGGVQVIDVPTLGLMLVTGSVSTSRGSVVQGNLSSDSTVRVDIDLLPANERVVISYQMRVVEGVEDVIQNQASISAQTGLAPTGAGPIVTDDPDIDGMDNVTLTPLGSSPPILQQLFLPLVAKQ